MRISFIVLLLLSVYSAAAQSLSYVPPVSKGYIANGPVAKTPKKIHETDTSKENKEPRYFYVTVSTNVFVNTLGTVGKRFSPSVEFGRTYGIFDIGLAAGRLNSIRDGSDTTYFMEVRPTINIFSKGRFSEALCLGAGYVFNGQQNFMTEICNSINFNISEKVALAISQGYYFFDGTYSNRTAQYMGVNLTYNFLRNDGVNKQRKHAALVNDN